MKGKRHEKIIEIIENQIILTQDDLQNALLQAGFKVTQSTVSRDIKELRLIKGHDTDGNYRYVAHKIGGGDQPAIQYHEMLKNSLLSIDYALNNVVIKSYAGMASSVCIAVDALFEKNMLGSVAGEDTILIITRTAESAQALCEEIKNLCKG